MSSTSSPTVSRRWLALEMRRLREERDLSQRAVAKTLSCQVPKVSLLENGKRPLQEADLKTLLELFEVPDEARVQYFAELQTAHEKGWWELYDEDTVPDWYRDFIGLEQGAERIRAYQSAVVHGLLQTPAYAAALYWADPLAGHSEEKVARLVDVRRRRQRVLRGDGGLRRLHVVLDEAALRHVAGDRRVMREQFDHVIELCESNDRITVGIVPFDRGGASAAAYGPFTLFAFRFETDPGLVYRELGSGSVFLDSLSELDDHSLMFQRLSELALPPGESLEMFRAAAKGSKG